MGIFNILKKIPSHWVKVNRAYRCYKPDFAKITFPKRQKQANNIIISIAKICKLNLDLCDARKYYEILTVYSDVAIRRAVTRSSNDQIFKSLQLKHKELVKSKETAMKILAFVTLNMQNHDFTIRSKNSISKLNFMVDSYRQIEKTVKENAEAENENLDDPEYGLVVFKPIYTQGVAGSHRYLDDLKSSSGEELTWKRVGATAVEGINGIIDVYETKLPSGEIYKTLYINMYGSKNSTKIPNGFMK